jgi:hypothetical protein
MSSSHDKDSSDSAFEALEHVRVDPVLREYMEDVKEAQLTLDEIESPDPDDIKTILSSLNEGWSKIELFEQRLSLTGRARISPGHTTDSVCVKGICSSNQLRQDENGAYIDFATEDMVCMGFDVDVEYEEGGFPTRPRIVLTFVTEEEYAERQEDGINRYDGCFAVYSEDLRAAEFEKPSAEAIEQYLKYHHRRVYEHINECVPPGPLGNKRLKYVLNNLRVSLDESSLRDGLVRYYIGHYISRRLDLASDMYEVSVTGDIESVDSSDMHVNSFDEGTVKIVKGYTIAIRMVEDMSDGEGIHRPQLVLAVPSRNDNGDYEAFLIRGRDVLSIKNLQNITRYFGAAATRKFGTIDDVEEYFNTVAASAHTKVPDDHHYEDLEVLEAYIDEDTKAAARIEGFDSERGLFTVSIESDICMVVAVYERLKAKYEVEKLTGSKLLKAYETIARELADEVTAFAELKNGDTVEPTGPFVAVAIDKKTGDVAPYASYGGEHVSGNFGAITVTQFPDLISAITRGGVGTSEFQLGIALHNVSSLDVAGAVDRATLENKIVVIPLTGELAPTLGKTITIDENRS